MYCAFTYKDQTDENQPGLRTMLKKPLNRLTWGEAQARDKLLPRWPVTAEVGVKNLREIFQALGIAASILRCRRTRPRERIQPDLLLLIFSSRVFTGQRWDDSILACPKPLRKKPSTPTIITKPGCSPMAAAGSESRVDLPCQCRACYGTVRGWAGQASDHALSILNSTQGWRSLCRGFSQKVKRERSGW